VNLYAIMKIVGTSVGFKASSVLDLRSAGVEDKLFLIRCRNFIDNVSACAHCDYDLGFFSSPERNGIT